MNGESFNPDLELEQFGTGEMAEDPIKIFGEFGFKIGDMVEVKLFGEEPYLGPIEKFTSEVGYNGETEYRAYVKVKNGDQLHYFNLNAIKEPSGALSVTKLKK